MPPSCTRKLPLPMTVNLLIILYAAKVKKPLGIYWMQLKENRNGKTFQVCLTVVTVVFYTIRQGRWKILKPCNSRVETHACGTVTFFPGKNWIWLKPPAAAR